MKHTLRTAVAMAALLFGGTAQSATPVAETKSGIEISAKNKEEKYPNNRREIVPNGYGGLSFSSYDGGHSPKEFGEYLQRNGLQKWNRKKV